jgi:prolactin regulatory element-binding protein
MYRLLRWVLPEGEDPHELVLSSDEEALVKLSDVGLQLAVSFSEAGSILATGGEVNECPITYFFIE